MARETSIELARERGSYPACREDTPIRNSTRTCIAPTGTISVIAVAYVKNILDGKQLREVNPYFADIAKEGGFYSEELMDEAASRDIRRRILVAWPLSPLPGTGDIIRAT